MQAAPRKPRVTLDQQALLDWMINGHLITSPNEVAEVFDVHPGTAKRKLDGLLFQDKVKLCEYHEEGHRLKVLDWRYGVNLDGS